MFRQKRKITRQSRCRMLDCSYVASITKLMIFQDVLMIRLRRLIYRANVFLCNLLSNQQPPDVGDTRVNQLSSRKELLSRSTHVCTYTCKRIANDREISVLLRSTDEWIWIYRDSVYRRVDKADLLILFDDTINPRNPRNLPSYRNFIVFFEKKSKWQIERKKRNAPISSIIIYTASEIRLYF